MKAPDIQYEIPNSLEDALATLGSAEHDCAPLAGGQSLLPMMHLRMARPDKLVDLNNLSELDFINLENTHVHIGAMVRYSALQASTTVQQHIPLFTEALPYIAHEAIRNRGTIGGSTALADPAAEMPALLKALDAIIVVASSNGQREIAANDFFLGIYETALQENELVHSVRVPVAKPEQRFGFYELARRHGDYAMAGVVVCADSVEPYSGLRIVFFSIGDHALSAKDAADALNGCMCKDADALELAQKSLSGLEYFEDMNASAETKAHLAGVVLKRALAMLHAGDT